jgi:probable F420-dependent oxidoreductase
MLLSTGLMARGRMGERDTLLAIAQSAESTGLTRVWFGDHVVYPVDYTHNYPAGDGSLPYNPASPQLDVVVAMSWVLASTRRVGVGTTVMVIAERQPVLLAKQLATLDRLSDGRLLLGVGVGWMPEEYEALGVPANARGARTDECIEALRALWTEEVPSYAGRHVSFAPLHCNPKPAQPGGIPIWVGGRGDRALERVAAYGHGWLPGTGDAEMIRDGWERIRRRAEELGRDGDAIGVVATISDLDLDVTKRKLADVAELGVTEAIVPAQGKNPDASAEFVAAIPGLLS